MTKEEAIRQAQDHLYLCNRVFLLEDGETETVKTVVAWETANDDWEPHVCFYHWGEENPDGKITHMPVREFLDRYSLAAGGTK